MARERINTSSAAIAEPEEPTTGEQLDLVPKSDSEKNLDRCAKAWLTAKAAREDANREAKIVEDEAHEQMCEAADAVGVSSFMFGGNLIVIEDLRKAKAKPVKVKVKDKKDDAGDEE